VNRWVADFVRPLYFKLTVQLTRNYNFFGEEPMAKVRNGYVVVVGCGGVGSWCALMLLRRWVIRSRLDMVQSLTLQRCRQAPAYRREPPAGSYRARRRANQCSLI
jgi:hypothetical protein